MKTWAAPNSEASVAHHITDVQMISKTTEPEKAKRTLMKTVKRTFIKSK